MGLGGNQRLRGEPFLLVRAMLGGVRWHIGVYVGHVEPTYSFSLLPSLSLLYHYFFFLSFFLSFFFFFFYSFIFSFLALFTFSKAELTSFFLFSQVGLWCVWNFGILTILLHWTFFVKVKYVGLGLLLSVFHHQRISWCIVDAAVGGHY
jgi:hypothetical protein